MRRAWTVLAAVGALAVTVGVAVPDARAATIQRQFKLRAPVAGHLKLAKITLRFRAGRGRRIVRVPGLRLSAKNGSLPRNVIAAGATAETAKTRSIVTYSALIVLINPSRPRRAAVMSGGAKSDITVFFMNLLTGESFLAPGMSAEVDPPKVEDYTDPDPVRPPEHSIVDDIIHPAGPGSSYLFLDSGGSVIVKYKQREAARNLVAAAELHPTAEQLARVGQGAAQAAEAGGSAAEQGRRLTAGLSANCSRANHDIKQQPQPTTSEQWLRLMFALYAIDQRLAFGTFALMPPVARVLVWDRFIELQRRYLYFFYIRVLLGIQRGEDPEQAYKEFNRQFGALATEIGNIERGAFRANCNLLS